MPIEKKPRSNNNHSQLERWLWALVGIATIYAISLIAFNVDRGFDITDESFYILHARNSDDIVGPLSFFGRYIGLLLTISGDNIAIIRLLGLGFLLVSALFFANALIRFRTDVLDEIISPVARLGSFASILGGALIYYGIWLITPSYNWLNLVAILIVATAMLDAARQAGSLSSPEQKSCWFFLSTSLIGFGGALAFLAKPPSAAALAVIALTWMLAISSLRRLWVPYLFISGLSALLFLLFHIILFEGSIGAFITKIKIGVELAGLLGAGHDVSQLLVEATKNLQALPARFFHQTYLTLTFSLLMAIFLFATKLSGDAKGLELSKKAVLALPAFAIILAFIQINTFHGWNNGGWIQGEVGLFYVLLLLVLLLVSSILLDQKKLKPESLALVALLIFFALAHGFGSSNGLLKASSGAFVFFAAGIVSLASWIDQRTKSRALLLTVSTVIVSTMILTLSAAYRKTYRLVGPISAQTEPVTLLGGATNLRVDEPTAQYIEGIRKLASQAGWRRGTPLIDLTGGSPGAAVILEGRAPGTPWLLGGYSGSTMFALRALALSSSRDLKNAWVLTAPKGWRRLPDQILMDIGISFPASFKKVGEIVTGYRQERQILWRPIVQNKSDLRITCTTNC